MITIPIVTILVVLILVGLALWVLQQLPIDAWVKNIVRVILVVVFVLWLIAVLLGGWPGVIRISR